MEEKFKCKCGAQFPKRDLSGSPRTQCPVCRTPIPIAAQAAPTPPPPAAPPKSPEPGPASPQAQPITPGPTSPAYAPAPSTTPHPIAQRTSWPALKIAIVAVAAVFILMSIGLAWMGYRESLKTQASRKWPSVMGTIIASSVRPHQNVGRYSYSRSIKSYDVELQYSYRVDGQSWQGHKITLFDLPMKLEEAEALANQYSAGSTHQVYYDPANPSDAVLSPGADGVDKFHLIFGVAMPAGLILCSLILLASAFLSKFGEQPITQQVLVR